MEIRNFSIISHIDHGKSTLADRFLELTGAVKKEELKEQFLDSMDLEREKGITIKMHPCRMVWRPRFENLEIENSLKITGSEFILNLIDTPGHIDFSYEISRALACCEGAILLVDATKGVQAQTLFNLEAAQKQGLVVLGCVNKVDAAAKEQVSQTKQELALILGLNESEITEVSGRTGQGVAELLQKIILQIPQPKQDQAETQIKALVFDSKYDSFSGVVAYVRVFEGEVKKGDRVLFFAQRAEAEVKEVGYFLPQLSPSAKLSAGEIGYLKTGIKEPDKVKVGDTITILSQKSKILNLVELLPGYKEPQPVLFLSLYPKDSDDFELLKDGLSKLKLNDPALDFQIESKMALGRGFRIGFLGNLHAEITVRRLKAEFGLDLVATAPQVAFSVVKKNGEQLVVSSPAFWPEPSQILETKEPWVGIEIVSPNHYFGAVFKVLQPFNGLLKETKSLTSQKSLLKVEAPLREIVSGGFYDSLKSVTQGFASFSFKPIGERAADLVKVDILISGQIEEVFSRITAQKKAFEDSKRFLEKLKEVLPAQQFSVALQAVISGKIIARETVRALRKDVTAPLYGGDITRKRKLLEQQKKGKKELKQKGRVNLPASVFLDILKN